jgi:hypothetical protein
MRQPERREDYQLVIPAWTLLLPLEWDRYSARAKLRWLNAQTRQLIHMQGQLEEEVGRPEPTGTSGEGARRQRATEDWNDARRHSA